MEELDHNKKFWEEQIAYSPFTVILVSDTTSRKKTLVGKLKTKLRGLSPQVNYTDRATAAVGEVVPTFAGRGCYVVSATDSHGR
jgi:hypothetical protein